MPFQLDHLQQSLGGAGVRRLAMVCNLLLLGWIAWMIAQPILAWLQPDTDTQTAGLPEQQIARTPEADESERYNIANWHLFGKPAAQPARISPAKANAPETRLNLELNGVYLDDQPEYSRAIISEKGKQQQHYRSGDQLPGNAVLDEIHEGHVLLLRNGRYERLALAENHTNTLPGITRASRPAAGRPDGNTRNLSTELPTAAIPVYKLLNLQPVLSDDVFKGMYIRAISNEGRRLLKTANVELKQNDIVTSVNGVEITSAEAGKTLLDNYTITERLELIVKRGDQTIPVIIDPDAGN